MKVRGKTKDYKAFEVKVDTLAVDQVLRFKAGEAPYVNWFYRRAYLNNIIISISLIDDDLVLLRVK